MKNSIMLIILSLILIPISVFMATWLWNTQLVPAIDGVNQVSMLQMFGIMVLFYILHPGVKSIKMNSKNDE